MNIPDNMPPLKAFDTGSAGESPPSSSAKSRAGGDDGSEGEKSKESQASKVAKLARERYALFLSDDGRPYAVANDGPHLAVPLRGKAGLRSQLARIYADENNGAVPSQTALADAMTVLEGVAAGTEPRVPQLRVARHGESIVVDLGTPDGRCVVVGPHGWQREPRSPVLFRRSGAMKSLPEPVRDGDGLATLRALLNIDEAGFRLLVAWLVAAFIPDLPHPILAFRGEQGTGKSKAAQMVIGIVDPSGAPKRTAPRDMRTWATQAFNSWALCLDNVSIVPDWLSDALCRAVTGEGVIDRALYTDDDVVVLEFRRVLAMTTIDAGALQGDLAERLLTLELNLIPEDKRREEADLDAAFSDGHAAILASLFDLLSQVVNALPDTTLTHRPRMADFARVLAAVDRVRGWNTLDSYRQSARDAVSDVLDGDPFGQAVLTLADRAGPDGVTMTAREILDAVEAPDKLPKGWPKDPTRAGAKLKRLAPTLRTVGVEIDDSQRGGNAQRKRLYAIRSTPQRLAEIEGASQRPQRPQRPHGDEHQGVSRENTMDAANPGMDAANSHSVQSSYRGDQQQQGPMDAADAMDTVSQPLSTDASRDPATSLHCPDCGEPLPPGRARCQSCFETLQKGSE